ncbi:alpha/beta hydrolase [Rickettsiales bacterium LUAb2]
MSNNNILIDSSGEKISAIYKPAANEEAPIALLLHPYPKHGGNMHSKVLVYMEQVLLKHGFTTLRFNFRSCDKLDSKSDSNYDNGISEIVDASVCLDWLQGRHPRNRKIVIAGFSFGAYIALQLMVRRTEINYFIAVSTPTNMFDISFVHPCPSDGIFIHPEKDELCPLKDADKIIKKIIKTKSHDVQFEVIKAADHFYVNHLAELQNVIDNYLTQQANKITTENNNE